LESRRLLSSIPLPTIPAGTFLVTSYGAKGDGTTNNTTAIQNAINAAIAAGGGTVEFTAAAGAYECGPITLGNKINLQIDSGAELQALPFSEYPGAGSTSSISNFIQASDDSNVEISGSGTIDGNGSAWWTAYNSNNNIQRPDLLRFNNDNIILIQNVTLQNSPMFHVAFGSTNNVTVDAITINTSASSPNTDGIDPAGSNYLIENCNISDGDDDIAIKPQNVACSNITIQNCTIGSGHGISVGGETNDGLNGLTVTNVTFNGTTNGIRLKADRSNGGVVQNLSYSDITMTNVEYPILIDSYYNGGNDLPSNPSSDPGQTYVAGQTPLWENISISNLTSTNSASNSNGGVIYGLPEAPVQNLSFTNVKITANVGMQINHARNVSFDSTSHITVSSGNDLFGSTSFPSPYDATVVAGGFVNSDIGTPTVVKGTSSALYDPDSTQWTIMGDGAGLASTSDQFNFSYTPINGDGGIQAQLKSLSNPGGGAVPAGGVMIRASTNASDPFAAVVQTTGNQIIFQWRSTAGGALQSSTPVSQSIGSIYVRVLRSGTSFSGYYSSDGVNWTQIGSTETISAIGATANAGLAVTAGSNGKLATAVFANVQMIASVANEYLFYFGSSAFDNSAMSPSAADQNAIATDKNALVSGPTATTATFSNISSYADGINGILIDFANLPAGVTFSASDFQFNVGNTSNSSSWSSAPAPTAVATWTGSNGDTFADIVWANNAIEEEWLQVTVLADANTHLASNVVFYYGNEIGATGISTATTGNGPVIRVTSADVVATQNNASLLQSVPITNLYDFNRDGKVTAADIVLCQNNTTLLGGLELITVGGSSGNVEIGHSRASVAAAASHSTSNSSNTLTNYSTSPTSSVLTQTSDPLQRSTTHRHG